MRATEIYWKDDKTHADFYLYYPYRKQVESVTVMPFSTKANQSAEADYKAGDLLVGSTLNAAPSTEAVRIEAKHIMSQVDIRLKPGAGFTESSLAAANVKVSLNNIKTSATVDLATATATATKAITKRTFAIISFCFPFVARIRPMAHTTFRPWLQKNSHGRKPVC